MCYTVNMEKMVGERPVLTWTCRDGSKACLRFDGVSYAVWTTGSDDEEMYAVHVDFGLGQAVQKLVDSISGEVSSTQEKEIDL
jgi:hypothetical protein